MERPPAVLVLALLLGTGSVVTAAGKERVVLVWERKPQAKAPGPTEKAVLALLAKRHEVVDGGGATGLYRDLKGARKLGRRLGAKKVLLGRVGVFGKTTVAELRVVEVAEEDCGVSAWVGAERTEELPGVVQVLLERARLIPFPKKPRPTVQAPPEFLVHRLSDPDRNVRFSSAVELGRRGDRSVAPDLVKALRDQDMFIRRAAARSLGILRAHAVVPDLIEMLGDGSYFVAVSASDALLKITRHDFGYREGLSRDDPKKLVQKGKAWWEANRQEVMRKYP